MKSDSLTSPMPPIALEPHEWDQLASILQAHLPGRKVWAFGSRATGQRVKRFSDLDLAIEGQQLTLLESAVLAEAFDESRLPFKVDVVQLAALTPEFRARIAPSLVILQK